MVYDVDLLIGHALALQEPFGAGAIAAIRRGIDFDFGHG